MNFVELNSLTIHLFDEEFHSRYNSIGFPSHPYDRIPRLITRVTHRNAIWKSAFRFIVPPKIKRNNVFNSYLVWCSPVFVVPFLHRHIAGRAALSVVLGLDVSIPWFFIMWAGHLRLLSVGFWKIEERVRSNKHIREFSICFNFNFHQKCT